MTKDEIKERAEEYVAIYLKCKYSFNYFCANYVMIEVPGENILLKPYEPQSKLIDMINKLHYILVLKSRQIGISTIMQAYITWLCVFYDNVVIGIISKDAPEATDFARKIMGIIDKLPVWLKPRRFTKRTERTFILSNGSRCYATPVAPNAPEKTLRGKDITFLVIDEAAFIRHLDSAWTSIVPALSTNQKAAKASKIPYGTVILSTPNKTVGIGKWFYKRYTESISGTDILKPFTIHWKDIPELAADPDWYRTQCALFGHDPRKIQQELELKFISTGGTFFDEGTLEKIQDSNVTPIARFKLFNGEVWQFEKPVEGRFYIMGVDTAPEHGTDFSAITIWDYLDMKQVWEYQGKCPVHDFVKVVKLAIAQYPGSLVIESISYGNQVVEELNRTDYCTMLYSEKRGENKIVPGLATTAKSRPLMIDALYSYITEFPEGVKSKRLAMELVGLVSKPSGRVEADIDCNDDLALATSLCFYVRKYDPPLMIAPQKILTSSFSEIMDMNDIGGSEVSSVSILRDVKNNIQDYAGFVDTLSFYKE